jgi:AcrR family transcriptional regulator
MATAAPTRTPTQERAVRTRAALLAAAQRDFSERGYAATTAKSIAERAGAATGSFYQYFADKDAALREIAVARLASVAERSLDDRIAALLERFGHVGDVEALAFVLFGMVEGAVHAHVLGGGMVPDDRFFAALVDALVRLALPSADDATKARRTAKSRADRVDFAGKPARNGRGRR